MCGFQQQLDTVLIGNLGAVNLSLEHQPFRIHQEMALSAAYLLPAIVAPSFAAYSGRFGRLGVDHPRAGVWVSPQPYPQALAQCRV